MKHVKVIMSSYNGAQYIERQLDSIFAQVGVKVSCLVRDDGSKDNTVEILRNYQDQYKNLKIIIGENIGWERSFLEALSSSDDADYYAFSDQDDVWMENKLFESINILEMSENKKVPLLFHCNKLSTDENLVTLSEQAKKIERPMNRKSALIQEYVQGCSCVINRVAKELISQYRPKLKVPHDYWIGLLCYYFGKVFYCSTPLFYHIHHGSNESNDGNLCGSRIDRLKKVINKEGYFNLANDLLEGYSYLLSDEEIKYLNLVKNNKSSFKIRIQLFLDNDFRRKSLLGTFAFKICLLAKQF